jgi:hypothetical protein
MSESSINASRTEAAIRLGDPLAADSTADMRRSPALSIALSIGVCGGLLATSVPQPLPNLSWTILYLLLAVEADVRRLEAPLWLSLPPLCVGLLTLGAVEGPGPAFHALGGAVLAAGLLLPVWHVGYASAGAVAAVAVLGALWGSAALLEVLLWATLLGAPFVAIRVAAGAKPSTLPLTVILGLAAAASQLF